MSSTTSEQQPPQQPFPSRILPSLRPGADSGALPRPPAQSTVLVDLSRQDVAVRVAGAFRGWASMGASRVLATDREVVIFEPPEAS